MGVDTSRRAPTRRRAERAGLDRARGRRPPPTRFWPRDGPSGARAACRCRIVVRWPTRRRPARSSGSRPAGVLDVASLAARRSSRPCLRRQPTTELGGVDLRWSRPRSHPRRRQRHLSGDTSAAWRRWPHPARCPMARCPGRDTRSVPARCGPRDRRRAPARAHRPPHGGGHRPCRSASFRQLGRRIAIASTTSSKPSPVVGGLVALLWSRHCTARHLHRSLNRRAPLAARLALLHGRDVATLARRLLLRPPQRSDGDLRHRVDPLGVTLVSTASRCSRTSWSAAGSSSRSVAAGAGHGGHVIVIGLGAVGISVVEGLLPRAAGVSSSRTTEPLPLPARPSVCRW